MASSSTSAPEGRVAGWYEAWNARLPSIGDLAFAAFWLALVSGALVAIPYDVAAAADSLQLLLLTNPAGTFLRALHYWSAQLFLVFTALHLIEHLARRTEARVRLGVWLRLVLSTVVVVYLMVSGYVLKGDAEGQLARQVMAGLLERLPLLGNAPPRPARGVRGLAPAPLRAARRHRHPADPRVHRRALPPRLAGRFGVARRPRASAVLSLALVPTLHDPANPVVKGPWYMLGLQELLHWLESPARAWIPLLLGLDPARPSPSPAAAVVTGGQDPPRGRARGLCRAHPRRTAPPRRELGVAAAGAPAGHHVHRPPALPPRPEGRTRPDSRGPRSSRGVPSLPP